jgi:hypothetical protein
VNVSMIVQVAAGSSGDAARSSERASVMASRTPTGSRS